MTDWEIEKLDPLDWEEEDFHQASSELDDPEFNPQPFAMGEIPLVQKRFYALLKRKLHTQIENQPPLFPWETELTEYEPDISEDAIPAFSRQMWLPQVANLMPVAIPETVLASLLDACTDTMGMIRPPSAKMVKAVQELFPDYARVLNEMVERIRLSTSFAPARLSHEEKQRQRQKLAAILPANYQEATLEQQMAVSLLVAKEILDTLTLMLSPRSREVERLWETNVGVVHLRADYNPETPNQTNRFSRQPLRVRVQLPKGGCLTLQANQESITAQRSYAGHLSVELSDWQVGQPYLLEVRLFDAGQMPLKFAIVCQQ
ncbi:hypothetical protein PN462_14795 [Spirulina sp. CS-785/01]|uniref:hypothetical protein n=1 Tax=Spirulina sp. CS-785/01 TaxID=3021716 RepID=UPI002330739D|nr:hypothetical protein [Spirulina sp. CS-785/01]MDB9314377.1 hypothetical protein [Spirulina sp. CS-785/01]